MVDTNDSERAGHIITIMTRLRFLSLKEKWLLLKNCPHNGLVKRLLTLAFNSHIFRLDLESINKKKTTSLEGADERLATFIHLHELLFSEEISVPKFIKGLSRIMKKLHVREFSFYEDLMSGGTCFLDFLTYKKFFLKKDNTEYVRFMRPCAANMDYAWGGKRFIVQPNYQGIQLKVILEKGKKPRLVAGDQIDYASRMKATLKIAKGFLKESGKDVIEFDGMLIPKDKKNRPQLSWKASECVLYIYDFVSDTLPLKKRMKVVSAFCAYMKEAKNKRILMMPTEVVTGSVIASDAKSFSRSNNPYCSRNGIIVKRWDSGYEHKRSEAWLTLTAFNDNKSGAFLGRATIVGFAPSLTKVFAVDNNGMEIEIESSPEAVKNLTKYIGYTVEYALALGYLKFRRVLYDKGREV